MAVGLYAIELAVGDSIEVVCTDGTKITLVGATFTPGGGITQLTGDGTAGPGSGSQALTVTGIQGHPVPVPPGSGTTVLTNVAGTLSWSATATTGITQLTSDVLAGPGTGSQAATVDSISGNVGGVVPITSPIRLIPAAPSATTGTINLPNSGSIAWAYTTGHDVDGIYVDGSGNVNVGADNNAQGVNLGTGTGVSTVNIGTSAGGAGITIGAAAASVLVGPLAGSGTRMVVASSAGVLSTQAIVTGGITQLTSDVLAGPGSGSQAATVDSISGNVGGVVPITSPIRLIPAAPSATTGTINLPNSGSIAWAYTTGHDVDGIYVDGSGNVNVGADNNAQGVNLGTGTGVSTVNIGTGGSEGANNINVGGPGTTNKVAALQGSGTRMVTATSTGVLGTEAIPTSSTNAAGLSTALPAATGSGDIFYCTDIPVLYFDDPNTDAWKQFSSEYLPYAPGVVAGNYTTPNNLLVLSQRAYTIHVVNPYSSDASQSLSPALASGSFNTNVAWFCKLVMSANWISGTSESPSVCLCMSNGTTSGTSTCRMIQAYFNPNGHVGYEIDSFTIGQTSATLVNSPNASVYNWAGLLGSGGKIRTRMLNDGSVLHYQGSSDGFYWIDFFSETQPYNFTNFGFYLGATQGTGDPNFAQGLVFENQTGTPTQNSVTNVTLASGIPTLTISGTNGYLPGDVVAIHGVGGNTGVNTGSGGLALGGGVAVLSVGTNTITVNASGGGSYTSGGTVTLLSR